MKRTLNFIILFFISIVAFGQSIDETFSIKKMKKDLDIFKQIREKANSGLYKYRTKEQIDSLYNWAYDEIHNLSTYRDFYNLICTLTDFEGSLHNSTYFPKKRFSSIKHEEKGYFPYPLKAIENKVLLNFKTDQIPLGSEILSINDKKVSKIIKELSRYYTTDGINITGKQMGVTHRFGKYYRYYFGLTDQFKIQFKLPFSEEIKTITIKSIGYSEYRKNIENRHSKLFDRLRFLDPNQNEIYTYNQVDSNTGILTINSFAIGSNENSEEHIIYKKWLDSIFSNLKKENIRNLVVDVRNNGGGTDPNDVITYSYLTSRNFKESKQAWISFNKIPMLKHYNSGIPKILRPLGVGKFNKYFQNRFPIEKNGKYYIGPETNEQKIRHPNKNAFTGNIYLLISPGVASAGSLFASMLAGNDNTMSIGEETIGGYYGHNGHTPFEYVLPKSKIVTRFFIDNITQDVPERSNQLKNRGIIPDHIVHQTFDDFITNKDTQLRYTLELIRNRSTIDVPKEVITKK